MKIVAVNFTFAIPGGMWVRRENGSNNWQSFAEIAKELGQTEMERLFGIAYANGMTGMWYNATNGKNCYENGQLVN